MTSWVRETLEQKSPDLKKEEIIQSSFFFFLVSEWDVWDGQGRGIMVGMNGDLMSKFYLTFRNLLTCHRVEVLT